MVEARRFTFPLPCSLFGGLGGDCWDGGYLSGDCWSGGYLSGDCWSGGYLRVGTHCGRSGDDRGTGGDRSSLVISIF